MPFANIAQAVLKGKVDGQDYRNVMHFGSDVTGWDADPNAILILLAQAVMQCAVSVLLPGLSNQISFEGVSAKRIFPAITDEVFDATDAGPGEVAGQALPSFCSMLIDVKTGGGGRRNRGRMFLPPPLETNAANSLLDSTGLALAAAFAACMAGKFLGAGGTTDWEIGVLSRKAVSEGSAINVAFKSATSLTAKPLISVQRRRKIGVGS